MKEEEEGVLFLGLVVFLEININFNEIKWDLAQF